MPKGCSFERAFRLEAMLKKGVTTRDIMEEFEVSKQSAQKMIDTMSTIKVVFEDGMNENGGIIYRI